jgi:hypothetical protein
MRWTMENLGEMSGDQLKELVREELEDLGVEINLIEIEAEDDSRVVVRGRADTRRNRELIVQIVAETLGVDEIVNGLVVGSGGDDDDDPLEDDDDDYEIKDEDDDTVGTEDMSRSMEDGIPYIPPSRPVFGGQEGRSRGNRRNAEKHDR